MQLSNSFQNSRTVSTSTTRRVLRASFLTCAFASIQVASAQAIFGATERAEAGATISVRGDSLDANAQFTVYPYAANGKKGAGIAVQQSGANGKIAMIQLPTNGGNVVYEVAATTSKGATNSVFVNRPRLQWLDAADAQPSGLVRVVGRNFKPFSTAAPSVSLTLNGTTLAAAVVSATDGTVTFRVPATAAVGTYVVNVNNGLSGTASASLNTLSLNVKAKGNDPFNLGVSWGSDFDAISKRVFNLKTDTRLVKKARADGVNDDAAALAAAINYVSSTGGGTVYLPAGKYRVDNGTNTQILPNVVLKGDGKGKTILQVGYRFTSEKAPTTGYWPLVIWGAGKGLCGLTDLTIENLNTNAAPNGVLRGAPIDQTTNSVFLKNLDIKLNNGTYLWIAMARKAVVADCDITSTSLTNGPIKLDDAKDLQFLRNNINYRANRVSLNFGQRNVIDGNTVRINNSYRVPGSAETGGIELSFGQQILVANNDIAGYGALPTKGPLDGELILTQNSIVPDFAFVGNVQAVSGRTVIPSAPWASAAWQSPNHPNLARMAMMIISGKGAGQWRWVTTWNTNMLVVDRPWQVVPDATSRYSISGITNFQQTYINNKLTEGSTGISIYSGALDSYALGNNLLNTGALMVRGDSRVANKVAGSNYSFFGAWDVSITNNTVVNNKSFMPGSISVAAMDVGGKVFGSMMAGIDVRGNSVTGNYLVRSNYEIWKEDGIEVTSISASNQKDDTTLNVGTILEDNTITRATNPVQIRKAAFGSFLNRMIEAAQAQLSRP